MLLTLYLTNRFHVAMHLFSSNNKSQMASHGMNESWNELTVKAGLDCDIYNS